MCKDFPERKTSSVALTADSLLLNLLLLLEASFIAYETCFDNMSQSIVIVRTVHGTPCLQHSIGATVRQTFNLWLELLQICYLSGK